MGSLLWAMAGSNVLYGLLYAMAPLVEKTREPMTAVFLFELAVIVLAAMGLDILITDPEPARENQIIRWLMRGGIGTLILAFVISAVKPALPPVNLLDGDTRPLMAAFVAILLAGLYHVWSRRLIGRRSMLVLIGCLAMIEQSTEVGWGWSQVHDADRMKMISALPDTQDLADFLSMQPNPKRVEKNDNDVPFNFGD